MCGYCTERNYILYLKDAKKNNKSVDDFYQTELLIQETADLPFTINKLKRDDNFPSLVNIVFCRLYEHFILDGFDYSLFNLIQSSWGNNEITSYFEKRREYPGNNFWGILGEEDIYRTEKNWQQFMSDKKQLVDNSLEVLAKYHDWWILGNNKEDSFLPEITMQMPGVYDFVDETTGGDWEMFYSIFPVLYFSLMVLFKYSGEQELIKILALSRPKDVPDFSACDLWLRRKAFSFCIDKHGIDFILHNVENIDLMHICYAILTGRLKLKELRKIKYRIWDSSYASPDNYYESEFGALNNLIDPLLALN